VVLLEELKPKISTPVEPIKPIYIEPGLPSSTKEPIVIKPRKINISSKTAVEWRLGLIKKGERILVIAPIEMEDILRNPIIIKYLFLIKKKG